MSTLKVEIVSFTLQPHPNANTLSIANVKGWNCVVKTDELKDQSLAVYIPIDSIVPKLEIFKFLEKYNYRVRTVKIRGVISQGLLMPLSILPQKDEAGNNIIYTEGQDVTNILGITKYEPPVPIHLSGTMVSSPSEFRKYTDIENYKNYPNIFRKGDKIIITEKIHGTNARFAIINGQFFVGSHKVALREEKGNLFWEVARKYDIERILRERFSGEDVILYGEIYGKKVQELDYGRSDSYGFVFYDIFTRDKFLDTMWLKRFWNYSGIRMVPILYEGGFNELCLNHANGPTILGNEVHMREGIVIKSQIEENHPKIGRKILKYVSEEYLLSKHKKTEYH